MTELTDTHRRAALRGREAVAQGRIKSGVWAARLFAVFVAVQTAVPLLRNGGPDWPTAIITLLMAGGLVVAAQRMKAGSQIAAVVLLILFVAMKIADWWLADQPVYSGLLWTVIVFGALCNGVWGTYGLTAVKRDALLVPPAPPKTADRGVR